MLKWDKNDYKVIHEDSLSHVEGKWCFMNDDRSLRHQLDGSPSEKNILLSFYEWELSRLIFTTALIDQVFARKDLLFVSLNNTVNATVKKRKIPVQTVIHSFSMNDPTFIATQIFATE